MNGSPGMERTNVRRKKGRSVALQPKTVQELMVIEDNLADVVSELRKIRLKMTESKLESVMLETSKAEGFIQYLRGEWIPTCFARVTKAEVKAKMALNSGKLKPRKSDGK